MQRRSAIGLLSCLLLNVPRQTRAQEQRTLRRVGWLFQGEPSSVQRGLSEQAAPFRKLGWVVGSNISFEVRAGNAYASFERYADELIALKVDVIVSGGSGTRAAMRATSTIPIVFYYGGDPVRDGFVASLAKPGANTTGLIILDREVDAKRVWLLREFLPGVRKVAVLTGGVDGSSRSTNVRSADEELYSSLAIQPLFFNLQKAADYEAAIDQAAREGAEAVVIRGIYFPNGPDIAALAVRNRLALIGEDPQLVESGILASVAPDLTEQFEVLAYLVDRILRGTKPSELPVQQPSRFEVCVNARTAAALRLAIPQSVRVSATRIVE
jgi:putative ABC transport system substrate-binding protein